MNVWYCIPSGLPEKEASACLGKWVGRGYRVAVFRDTGAASLPVDLCLHGHYPGYAVAVNALARAVLAFDPSCQWVVIGGDDILPDPDHDPRVIAAECTEHFRGTLGVLQPTGDRFMEDAQGLCGAERVCISPWMGREWCLRAYEGKGPLWPAYKHEFVDEDLHEVASMHGRLWHRRDLTQHHDWHGRRKEPPPAHMKGKQAWNEEGKRIFQTRKEAGFPESRFLK